jgi:hypothetical protein
MSFDLFINPSRHDKAVLVTLSHCHTRRQNTLLHHACAPFTATLFPDASAHSEK